MSSEGIAAQLTSMKGPSDLEDRRWRARRGQLLSGPVLAGDEYPGLGRACLLDPVQDLPDRVGAPHDLVVDLHLALEALDALGKPTDAEGIPERDQEPIGVQRLFQEVESPLAGGLDGRVDRTVARDHDDRRVAVLTPDPLQHLEAVHPRHLHVEEGHVRLHVGIVDQPARTVGGEVDVVAFVLEDLT